MEAIKTMWGLIPKTQKRLIVFLGFVILFVFIAIIVLYDKLYRIRFLYWNLFLAVLPLFFSTLSVYFFKKLKKEKIKKTKNKTFFVFFALLWLGFFPNSPYIITDIIHLTYYAFYQRGVGFLPYPTSWFALTLLTLAIISGCLIGYISLYQMQKSLFKDQNIKQLLFVMVVSLLSGIAIFMGRIMRFNSWDLASRPLYLIKKVLKEVSPNTIILSLVFAFMVIMTYAMYYFIAGGCEKDDN